MRLGHEGRDCEVAFGGGQTHPAGPARRVFESRLEQPSIEDGALESMLGGV